MTSINLSRRALLGAALGAAMPFSPARAQLGGGQSLRWVVPYAAGGGSDVLARLLATRLSERLGTTVVIDNRPGGATSIGAEAVARATPDGRTVLTADNGTLVFNMALFQRLSYDPERDFRPVGLMARFHLVLCAQPGSSIADVKELVAAARARPGTLTYASAGIGSPHHLSMARLARELEIELNHVPYRGSAPALNDLLANTVDMMAIDMAAGGEYLRSGRVKPLAILSAARHPELPQVPTVREALGLPEFEAYAWQGMVLPRGASDAATERLSSELGAVLAEPAIASRMRGMGMEPLTGGPAEFEALLASERRIWVPLIRALGITVD